MLASGDQADAIAGSTDGQAKTLYATTLSAQPTVLLRRDERKGSRCTPPPLTHRTQVPSGASSRIPNSRRLPGGTKQRSLWTITESIGAAREDACFRCGERACGPPVRALLRLVQGEHLVMAIETLARNAEASVRRRELSARRRLAVLAQVLRPGRGHRHEHAALAGAWRRAMKPRSLASSHTARRGHDVRHASSTSA